jgi:hypothetical protein
LQLDRGGIVVISLMPHTCPRRIGYGLKLKWKRSKNFLALNLRVVYGILLREYGFVNNEDILLFKEGWYE